MKQAREDRRVKYTKMVLKESFINLLEKKEISQITIKEICEDADINRSTFYTHYTDQYDLLRKIENELLDNVSAHLAELIIRIREWMILHWLRKYLTISRKMPSCVSYFLVSVEI